MYIPTFGGIAYVPFDFEHQCTLGWKLWGLTGLLRLRELRMEAAAVVQILPYAEQMSKRHLFLW